MQLETSGKAVFANIIAPDAQRIDYWLSERVLQHDIPVIVRGEDRYGRSIITSNLESEMLRDGVAMIYATDGDIPADWWASERAARAQGGGVWSVKERVLTPENAAAHIGKFALVEGTVKRIYTSKSATYINFGDDWHSDFSVTIPGKTRRNMKDTLGAIKPGTRLSVRGMLYEENGPMIKLMSAENLVRL